MKGCIRFVFILIVCFLTGVGIGWSVDTLFLDKVNAKELVHEQEVVFVEPDIFSNALFPTCPDYTDPDVTTADFSVTPAPSMEWVLEPSPGSETKPFDIMDFIPTWPDYIELEKDLVIGHNTFVNPNGSIGDSYGIVIEKGTKIYFKDD